MRYASLSAAVALALLISDPVPASAQVGLPDTEVCTTMGTGYFCTPMLNCNGTNEIKSVSGCSNSSDACCGPKGFSGSSSSSSSSSGSGPGDACMGQVADGACSWSGGSGTCQNTSVGFICVSVSASSSGGSSSSSASSSSGGSSSSSASSGSGGATVSCPGGVIKGGVCFPGGTGLPDPVGGVAGVLANLMDWLLAIFGMIAVIAFIISGMQYLTAAGDEHQAETAKRNMKYSIVGLAVALSAYVIIDAIECMFGGGFFFC